MKTGRLRRTLLWTKGHKPEEVTAALASNADCIVFECEDMVIPPERRRRFRARPTQCAP